MRTLGWDSLDYFNPRLTLHRKRKKNLVAYEFGLWCMTVLVVHVSFPHLSVSSFSFSLLVFSPPFKFSVTLNPLPPLSVISSGNSLRYFPPSRSLNLPLQHSHTLLAVPSSYSLSFISPDSSPDCWSALKLKPFTTCFIISCLFLSTMPVTVSFLLCPVLYPLCC